jgi:hypothetical protein
MCYIPIMKIEVVDETTGTRHTCDGITIIIRRAEEKTLADRFWEAVGNFSFFEAGVFVVKLAVAAGVIFILWHWPW